MFKVTVSTQIGETSWKHTITSDNYATAVYDSFDYIGTELDRRGWCGVRFSQRFIGALSRKIIIREEGEIIGYSIMNVCEV